jgi:DNA/RNA endonuclease YhcR with UshA esterase domain
MKKRILLILGFFALLSSAAIGQAVEGGAGVVFVDADPNGVVALQDVSANEANIAYNRATQIMYVFDPAGTAGVDQWIAVDVTSTVTSVVGTNDISVTNVGSVYTVDFTEALTSLTWDSGTHTLTYTDEDGTDNDVVIDGTTDVNGSNSINITGDGSVATPYVIELDGAHTGGNAGFVPVTDGAGNLTWQEVIDAAAFTAAGELELTFTDGSTVFVDMSSIPTAVDDAALGILAGAVDATSGGVAKAAVNNTFGLPATANYSVLFIINQ